MELFVKQDEMKFAIDCVFEKELRERYSEQIVCLNLFDSKENCRFLFYLSALK